MLPPLPLPDHFDPDRVGDVWRVDYEARAAEARAWAGAHPIPPAAEDGFRVGLLLIDVQNTFCLPGFELYVAGRSGTGAVDDNRRLCAFLYRHLPRITRVVATMDTHQALQIFHSLFLVDAEGRHPGPYTLVTAEDVAAGRWRFNEAVAGSLGLGAGEGQRHLEHYTRTLEARGRYALIVWPYHALLGGIGHAMVPAVEEAVFFHGIARYSQPHLHLKGRHPLTESYSALGPDVAQDADGQPLAGYDEAFLEHLLAYDALLVAGQAKSHCVAWTLADLARSLEQRDPADAPEVYLLEDCTSPVVVPGADFTDEAEAAFARFEEAGMHRVRTTDPIDTWPGPLAERFAGTTPAR